MDGEQAPERDGVAPAASMVGSVLRGIREQALRLSLEARDYFGAHWPPDPRSTPLDDRMVMNREMLFISARLSQVVLWAITQDGGTDENAMPGETSATAAAGQSDTVDQAADDSPLEPWTVDPLLLSPADNVGGQVSYHPRFQALREGSLALYERVSRLHEQSTANDASVASSEN